MSAETLEDLNVEVEKIDVEVLPKETPPPEIINKLPDSNYATNLERFHYLCKDLPSSDLFIDFNFYFMVSSALARKVWVGEGEYYKLFPNLYVVAVSDPGLGKSMPASSGARILASLEHTHVDSKSGEMHTKKLVTLGPDAITFEKLVLRAAASTTVIPWPGGPKKHYHHTSTCFYLADEMEMLFSENTRRVISFLMQAWDCHNIETDTIKHGKIVIRDVCLNFFGCTTPEIMKNLIRTNVLNSGFTGRAIFLFSDKKRKVVSKITTSKEQENEIEHFKKHLRQLCVLPPTQVFYTKAAEDWLENWTHTKWEKRSNDHPKLKDFYARKQANLIKLATGIHYADKLTNHLEVEDFIAAESLLLRAEKNMHKALAASGENNNYKLSEDIKTALAIKGPIPKARLYIDFWHQAFNGTASLDEVIAFMKNTGQIEEMNDIKNRLCFKLVDNSKPIVDTKID